MADLGPIHDPVPFDHAAADALVARLHAGADLLRAQKTRRNTLATTARKDWRGVYDGKFAARMKVCLTDAERLAHAMDQAAKQVQQLAKAATEEQKRRNVAKKYERDHKEWKERRARRDGLHAFCDTLAEHTPWGDSHEPKPPHGPRSKMVLPVQAPLIKGRD